VTQEVADLGKIEKKRNELYNDLDILALWALRKGHMQGQVAIVRHHTTEYSFV
jgi:hypothetical protein